jgi:hypothetical protein
LVSSMCHQRAAIGAVLSKSYAKSYSDPTLFAAPAVVIAGAHHGTITARHAIVTAFSRRSIMVDSLASCFGKVRFDDPAIARQIASRRYDHRNRISKHRKGRGPVKVYRCHHCGGWHLAAMNEL